MKALIFTLGILFAMQIVALSQIPQKYIDLQNPVVNDRYKPGWGQFGFPDFSDEFNTNIIKYPDNAPDTTDDMWKVLNGNWLCRWSSLSRVGDPCYDKVENNDINSYLYRMNQNL